MDLLTRKVLSSNQKHKNPAPLAVCFSGNKAEPGDAILSRRVQSIPTRPHSSTCWGTSPGTTGRVGTTAAVVVVHGWQGRTNRAVGQGVGHRTASSLAHLSSNLLQYKPAGARALKRVKSKLKLTLRLGWRIPQKKLNLKFCKRNFCGLLVLPFCTV